ncbi:hypothetical protein [Tenacibaculum finnmarkense]|uniref:hypothetical protein n=1 Tax=Tenacibaculum finnmarkense TaxID=2781243 RepID=UPI00187B72AB|nr:hypothetical protein [Tenacibaculum finnmarkense]MBE7649043.1 hypothetical protein [Tenacibaculum finnmarkense genomovar ulcerans]
MIYFKNYLKIDPPKYSNNTLIKEARMFNFKHLATIGLFFCLATHAQTEVSTSSHLEQTKAFEISYVKGKNNFGASFGGMYFLRDNIHLKLFTGYSKFSYKSYSENILNGGLELGITFWEGNTRSRNQLFSLFNFTALAGTDYELVKVTSDTVLIEEYPKHIYVYLGGNLEYSLSVSFGLSVFFKEFYAINGSKDKLGNWRYNLGVSLRYYIFR